MDHWIRDFLWGFDASKSHHFYPKAWDTLCRSKLLGRLGIRQMDDINSTLITKLAWNVCTRSKKIWIQLIQAQYLRGRNILDFHQTTRIWGSIKASIPTLRVGICFQVGKTSTVRIRDDPWLCNEEGFYIPSEINIPHNVIFLRHLMLSNGL